MKHLKVIFEVELNWPIRYKIADHLFLRSFCEVIGLLPCGFPSSVFFGILWTLPCPLFPAACWVNWELLAPGIGEVGMLFCIPELLFITYEPQNYDEWLERKLNEHFGIDGAVL